MNFRLNQGNGMIDLACFSDIEDDTNGGDDVIIQKFHLFIFLLFLLGYCSERKSHYVAYIGM